MDIRTVSVPVMSNAMNLADRRTTHSFPHRHAGRRRNLVHLVGCMGWILCRIPLYAEAGLQSDIGEIPPTISRLTAVLTP